MPYLHELIQEAIDQKEWPLLISDQEGRTYRIEHTNGAIWWDPQGTAVIMYAHQIISDRWQRIYPKIDWAKVRHGSVLRTRGGRDVRILCTDCDDPELPIVGLIKRGEKEQAEMWTATGGWLEDNRREDQDDLVSVVKY